MTREMIREMEIINTSKLYSEHEYNKIIFENGCIMGARWADDNHKSPWISVEDDLPYKHKELIIENRTITMITYHKTEVIMDNYMFYENGKWEWIMGNPCYWFPMPKLPKE